MIPWLTLIVSLAALIVAIIALYQATHTNRKVQVIPPPCQHKWNVWQSSEQVNRWGHCKGYVHTLCCAGCGDLAVKRVTMNDPYGTDSQ
ncbi:hypothetical protein D3C87_970450 [compost metagenome]